MRRSQGGHAPTGSGRATDVLVCAASGREYPGRWELPRRQPDEGREEEDLEEEPPEAWAEARNDADRLVDRSGGPIRVNSHRVAAAGPGPRCCYYVLDGPRLATANAHGTGCTLASALAAGLAKGRSLPAAARAAKAFVATCLARSRGGRLGEGPQGPLNHGFAVGDWPLPDDADAASSTSLGG